MTELEIVKAAIGQLDLDQVVALVPVIIRRAATIAAATDDVIVRRTCARVMIRCGAPSATIRQATRLGPGAIAQLRLQVHADVERLRLRREFPA